MHTRAHEENFSRVNRLPHQHEDAIQNHVTAAPLLSKQVL